MTSFSSDSESFISADDSVADYELEEEDAANDTQFPQSQEEEQDGVVPYADEPIANEEWLRQYRKEKEEEEIKRQSLQDRLNGIEHRESWCSCGKCDIELLQNAYECQCCREIEKCVEALSKDLVLQEVKTPPVCITLHPGFRSVCLDKWSLRLSAGKFKTKNNRRYRQSGSEEAFLRVVSYREFTQLVYGYLGNIRIPMPACAYDKIRREFPAKKESYTGFEEDEDES